ncbi:PAS domain-containing protein [Rhodobacteraceae bacterium 2CG4]|uniref:PAS domain-containing protein n=1 Tax=Halovulum marinum TaxID=2662447 RepID=A0A6L5YYS2_9RHOB|nr:PAS-domain containing protein [Halovulum marinum]MSU89436.1 PAS domain-containing protein [Halovulum marinum]
MPLSSLLRTVMRLPRDRDRRSALPHPHGCRLTFAGDRVDRARGRVPAVGGAAVDPAPLSGMRVLDLADRLGLDAALRAALDALVGEGTGFVEHHRLADRRLWRLTGRTEGLTACLALEPATPAEAALHDRLTAAAATVDELQAVARRSELSPVPTFESDATGRILWHNRAAGPLARMAGGLGAIPGLIASGDGTSQLCTSDGTRLGWGRITTVPSDIGGQLIFVEDIDAQIRAEEALDSFTSTLTDTFAHIDTALAVFDRERRLSLFNPALHDLFGLDPVGLAMRPSLREFLEALRQRRMVPEQTDFSAWRQRITAAATTVSEVPYHEDWSLPSGQVLRVTARPHPRGAVAFVFDDISDYVTLERRYRAEIELGHAMLERLDEGVALFDRSGRVLFTNDVFERAMRRESLDDLLSAGLDGLTEAARTASADPETWLAFKAFALAAERQEHWAAVAETGDGRLLLRASAMPDGSTLLGLLDPDPAAAAPTPDLAQPLRRIGCG